MRKVELARRSTLLTIVFLITVQSAAAQGIQTHYFNQTMEAVPGEETVLGELQITADGTSLQNIETHLDLPFNASIQPETRSQLLEGESYNATVQVGPPADEKPENFTEEILVESDNHDTTQELQFFLAAVNNWTVNETSIEEEFANEESGKLTTLQVEQHGNVPDEIDISITGNITNLLETRATIQALPALPQRFTVDYEIPFDQEPGNYTGAIEFEGTNHSQTVDVSLGVRDETPPEIVDTRFKDVEATQNTEFQVITTDNIKIGVVLGEVYQLVEDGNGTEARVLEEFMFTHDSGDNYTHTFRETSEIGNYSVNVTAIDTSGNNQTVTEQFQVLPLDAVRVWDFNFNIGEVIQGAEKDRTILEVTDDSDIELVWDNIVPEDVQVEIGLIHEDWEATRYFNEPGDSIELRETGNYSVVTNTVFGENITTFNTRLTLELPEQHVEEEDIIFEGRAIQNFAEPMEFTEAGLQGRLFYSEFEDGIPVTKAVYVEGDASDCQGVQLMTDCIPGLDHGAIVELTESNQQLSSRLTLWKSATVFLGFFAIVVWIGGRRVRRNAGLLYTQRMIQYNNVATSPFFDEEDRERSKPGESKLKIFDNNK